MDIHCTCIYSARSWARELIYTLHPIRRQGFTPRLWCTILHDLCLLSYKEHKCSASWLNSKNPPSPQKTSLKDNGLIFQTEQPLNQAELLFAQRIMGYCYKENLRYAVVLLPDVTASGCLRFITIPQKSFSYIKFL